MPLINIFIVLLLVAANGFFVACEFSLVAVRPTANSHVARKRGPGRITSWSRSLFIQSYWGDKLIWLHCQNGTAY